LINFLKNQLIEKLMSKIYITRPKMTSINKINTTI